MVHSPQGQPLGGGAGRPAAVRDADQPQLRQAQGQHSHVGAQHSGHVGSSESSESDSSDSESTSSSSEESSLSLVPPKPNLGGRPPTPGSDAYYRQIGLLKPPLVEAAPVALSDDALCQTIRPVGSAASCFVASVLRYDNANKALGVTATSALDKILGANYVDLSGTRLLAERIGVPRQTLDKWLFTLASASYFASRALASSIISRYIRMAEEKTVDIVGLFSSVAYDETPIRMNISKDGGKPGVLAKILQVEVELAILAKCPFSGKYTMSVL